MQHEIYELRQMQAMPLDIKIRMTKERIEAWYDNWTRFDILNTKTGKTRFKTIDTRDKYKEPPLKENEIIQTAYDGQIYVAFSGGKDSTVLKHMVDSMYDDVPPVFADTGLEYPEIRQFAMCQKNVVVVRPKKTFKQVLITKGYPVVSKEVAHRVKFARSALRRGDTNTTDLLKLRGEYRDPRSGTLSMFNQKKWGFLLDAPFAISDECCANIKEAPSGIYQRETGRMPVTAIMASESMRRTSRWLQYGCNAFDSSNPMSAPMSFWTEQDVLQYLVKYNIPYCSVYGDIRRKNVLDGQAAFDGFGGLDGEELETTGAKRTGCIFCMFGCHLEDEPNRFQRLKKTHPRQWEYCIKGGEFNADGMWQPSRTGLGLGFVLDYIGVKYE